MITKAFARCLAKISGDGNLYYRYIRYSNTCKELREEFRQDIIKEFGQINFTSGVGNSGTPFLQIHGKKIIQEFLNYLPDFRSNYIFIPLSIKKAHKSIQKEYLRAFYDDEGCASLRLSTKHNDWKRSITLCSNSLKILTEIKMMLYLNFDISSNRIIRNKPHSNYDRSYILCITGRGNILSFKRKIGFKHPRKSKRLELMMRSYYATSKNVIAFNKLKDEVYNS